MSGFACVKESNGVAKAVRRNGWTENELGFVSNASIHNKITVAKTAN